MLTTKRYELWFVVGSQHLYGKKTLDEVAEHSEMMVSAMNEEFNEHFTIVMKPVMTNANDIYQLCLEANRTAHCAGLLTWMHTFSPAKMWIRGLKSLTKPLLHLHTQYNRDLPWDSINMDFMNLNQSAHGDREFGYMNARMKTRPKVVVGHWQDRNVINEIKRWATSALAFNESHAIKVARFGDNMNHVAVTDGDKVEAQIQFGWQVDGFGIGDLVAKMEALTEEEIDSLMAEYETIYKFDGPLQVDGPERDAVREQAKIELGLEYFLKEGQYTAFTTNFDTLHGMKQLPGLAVQRLMAKGYGFGGEGDWKTAALLRLMKIMSGGKETSFMEDYTYHLKPGEEGILQSHMLEVCPTIASDQPRVEVHPLAIGGKEDPARLVFNAQPGKGICVTVIDMGERFRFIVNDVETIEMTENMPHLPVARAFWKPAPSLHESAKAWILAGGTHHTAYSTQLTYQHIKDYAEMTGSECLHIGEKFNLDDFTNELKWNELYYKFM
ncbi:L-arabinose isomerase [Pseudalkalibacillus hwajinpoensis]|uniref:L-arabinose isomerase n=1 Tax=Guptibacillus hwajinpoensis TaxID=208199 RepID=UPI001CD670B0|nr:L-arabinose isomerase [Pseudalkalibacillus hwajinpoensis]MCA0991332.1 L-arabinose isomerase [Pseudalkalibacillus hwajinpoensis]